MQETIREAITNALSALGISPVVFSVEHPTDLSHGDYATNVALVAAKQAGKNPPQRGGGNRRGEGRGAGGAGGREDAGQRPRRGGRGRAAGSLKETSLMAWKR